MTIDMKCNMCGVTLQLDETRAGSMINCPSCGQKIFVQKADTDDIVPIGSDKPFLQGDYSPPLQETHTSGGVPASVEASDSMPPPLAAGVLGSDTDSSLVELVANGDSPRLAPVVAFQESLATLDSELSRGPDRVEDEYRVADEQPATRGSGVSRATVVRGDAEQQSNSTNPVPLHDRRDPIESHSAAMTVDDTHAPRLKVATLVAVYVAGVVSGLMIGKLIFGS